jgi:hypothetical protein
MKADPGFTQHTNSLAECSQAPGLTSHSTGESSGSDCMADAMQQDGCCPLAPASDRALVERLFSLP